jgi:hypothetical protein
MIVNTRDIPVDGEPIDCLVMRVDQHQLSSKSGAPQVAYDHRADRAGPWRSTDQHYRSRFEELVEVSNRHRVLPVF